MMFRISQWTIAATTALMICGLAQAQPKLPGSGGGGGEPQPAGGIIQGTKPELTLERVREAGYEDAQIYTARSGRRHVSGRVAGMPVSVIHHNCKDDLCPALVYMTNFGKQPTIDANYINAWNRDKLYANLYTDKEGNLWFSMAAYVVDVAPQYITSTSKIFAAMLRQVMQYKPPE